MLAGVQIEQKLNQSPFQPRPPASVKQKPRPGELRRPREIDQAQAFAELDMRFRFEIQPRLLAPHPHLPIVLRRFPLLDRFVRQIGQLQQQGVALLGSLRHFLVQFGNARAHIPCFLLFGFGFSGLFLPQERANFLGYAVSRGLESFNFGQPRAPAFVQCQQRADLLLVTAVAGGQALPDEIGFFANQSDIEHRRIIKMPRSTASGEWTQNAIIDFSARSATLRENSFLLIS